MRKRRISKLILGQAPAAVMLFALWLMLSWHFSPLLIALGGLSALAAAGTGLRMNTHAGLIGEFLPAPRILISYIFWLAREVIHSNIMVARLILTPSLPIKPAFTHTIDRSAGTRSAALLANSITLTPGTVTVSTNERRFLVHALLMKPDSAKGLAEMAKRVARL